MTSATVRMLQPMGLGFGFTSAFTNFRSLIAALVLSESHREALGQVACWVKAFVQTFAFQLVDKFPLYWFVTLGKKLF